MHRRIQNKSLAAFAALALLVPIAPPGAIAESNGRREARSPVHDSARDVAWRNRAYDFGDGATYFFSEGRHAELNESQECTVCLWIAKLSFGDVDCDGKDEALIVLSTNLGGAGTTLEGYVFGEENGVAVLRAKVEGGDRGDGGVQSLAVIGHDVVVRRFALSPDDGVCCPSRIETQRWRWTDGKLVKRGPLRTAPWRSREWRFRTRAP